VAYHSFHVQKQREELFLPNNYCYATSERRPKWLDKALQWVWGKLSKPAAVGSTTFKTIAVEHERIIDAIVAQRRNIDMIYHQKARCVIMGSNQFYEAVSEAEKRSAFMHSFNVPIQLGGIDGIKIVGLDVHVVPWFDGILVLPADIGKVSTQTH
jgi:hypothetical protein